MKFKLKFPLFTAMRKGEGDQSEQMCVDAGGTFIVKYVCSGADDGKTDMVYIGGAFENGEEWLARLSLQAFYFIAAPVTIPEQVKSIKEQLQQKRAIK